MKYLGTATYTQYDYPDDSSSHQELLEVEAKDKTEAYSKVYDYYDNLGSPYGTTYLLNSFHFLTKIL
jgi:hypothetical protein